MEREASREWRASSWSGVGVAGAGGNRGMGAAAADMGVVLGLGRLGAESSLPEISFQKTPQSFSCKQKTRRELPRVEEEKSYSM